MSIGEALRLVIVDQLWINALPVETNASGTKAGLKLEESCYTPFCQEGWHSELQVSHTPSLP